MLTTCSRNPAARRLAVGAVWLVWVGCGDGPRPAADAGSPVDADTSCNVGDFQWAPPPYQAEDGLRVFLDFDRIEAHLVFDVETEQATATATVWFRTGDAGGEPVFDLRQSIDHGELDGVQIAPDALGFHGFGLDTASGFRVAERTVEPCSEHQLYLEYQLGEPSPQVENGRAPVYADGGLTWGFKLYDVWPGRLLEQWIPANLPYDRFELTVDVDVVGTSVDHTVITNGELESLGVGSWRVTFPSYFTAFSPLLEVVPSDDLASSTTAVACADDQSVDLVIHRHSVITVDLAELEATLSQGLQEFTASDGPYLHGDRFVAYVLSAQHYQAEEYEGGTTVFANPGTLRHELYHSWFGRGVLPARNNDDWFDEAWVMYVTDDPVDPLDREQDPVELSPASPYFRGTPTQAYHEGAQLFTTLAALIGDSELRALMRDFVQGHPLERVTSQDLERHLTCGSGQPEVRFWFHRFVYGLDGEPDPIPDGWCD